jgi:triacylglycerol esterase/lipase EstA (alpha/beta hydrolase family)
MLVLLSIFACSNSKVPDQSNEIVEEENNKTEEEIVDTGTENVPVCSGTAGNLATIEGATLQLEGLTTATRKYCTGLLHPFFGPIDSTIAVNVVAWPTDSLRIRLEDVAGEPILDWQDFSTHASYQFILPRSGEFFIHIEPEDIEEPEHEYSLELQCISNCDAEFTRYPILFFHGLAGFDSLLNVMDYFDGVEEVLVEQGYHAEFPSVAAFDTIDNRAISWQEQMQDLVDSGVARKFNIIAHSQGGLDARYLASVLGESNRIASITTISTPHHGTVVSDAYTGIVEVSFWDGGIIDEIVSFGSELFGVEGENFTEQLEQMTTTSMNEFNENVPDAEDVAYYSWAGKSCRFLQWDCQEEMDGEVVTSYFATTHWYIEEYQGANDGLVAVESAIWGEYLGVLPADHIDQMGHRFDNSSQVFDSQAFFLSEARRLSEEGF